MAVNDANKLIVLEKTLESTKRYFGTYIFFINGPFERIADIELVVDSE